MIKQDEPQSCLYLGSHTSVIPIFISGFLVRKSTFNNLFCFAFVNWHFCNKNELFVWLLHYFCSVKKGAWESSVRVKWKSYFSHYTSILFSQLY